MRQRSPKNITKLGMVLLVMLTVSGGCHLAQPAAPVVDHLPPVVPMPRELDKMVLPTYRIEPPDMLVIDVINAVPKSPYHLRSLDSLMVQSLGTLPDAPVDGIYVLGPGGMVNLGAPYGRVKVTGMTVEKAQEAITVHLKKQLKSPDVSVSLANLAATQQITGENLVGPDGTITLGSYGSVSVVGQTVAEAKKTVEKHLSQFLEDPEVSLSVFAFNSKVYYIITQGAGLGDGVYRFPVTGNETVLDAIAQINGLSEVSSKRIWIARPSPSGQSAQILRVDWLAITEQASTSSNYQILPGDRLFVAEDKLVAFDTGLAKFTAPLERIFGFALLGAGATTRLSGNVLRGGGDQRRF
jgi:polysaccharide export outer membrane protein